MATHPHHVCAPALVVIRARPFAPLLLVILFSLGSCSLAVNFKKECTTDDDCELVEICTSGFCELGDGPPRVIVNSNISRDTRWTNDRVWVLDALVTVLPSVTLTIERGTTVLGNRGAALVALEGGVINAVGTREQPIVFTSSKPVGQRQTGDWGGLAMMGKAPVNRPNATLRLIPNEAEARFGGADPTWNCGTLRYVRIEFGGGQVAQDEALNGLTLAGCGTRTLIDHVHVHYGADDGVEIFGGTTNLQYVLVTRAQDDGFDIDLGWTGRAQYIAIQSDSAADNAIEIDNLQEDPTRPPLTDFRISNFTIIGPGSSAMGLVNGIKVKAGGGGFFTHGIIMGPTVDAVDVEGLEAGARALAGDVIVQHTMFFDTGAGGTSYFPIAGEEGELGPGGEPDDDGGFPEDEFFREPQFGNKFGIDPKIARPYDLNDPTWAPTASEAFDVPPPPADFQQLGVFHGAFAPNVVPWTDGWTEFPGG